MNKIYLSLFLFFTAFIKCETPDYDKIFFEDLKASFKKYQLNATWIIEDAIVLKVNDFNKIWDELVETLTKSENRWYYFCDKPEEFDDDVYWKNSYNQCVIFDRWLKQLCVNVKTQELFLRNQIQKNILEARQQSVSIFDYWDYISQETGENKFHQFYAFYIDCLTHVFNEYVNIAKEYIGQRDQFVNFYKQAHNCLVNMEKNLAMIQDSKNYPQYQISVVALAQVLVLLEQESVIG